MKKCFILIFALTIISVTAIAEQNSQNHRPQMSLSEQLAFSTVRIEVVTNHGISIGTGFFFSFLEDGKQNVPAIVTNKHVIKDSITGTFMLTSSNDDGTPNLSIHIPVSLNNFEGRWILHPDNNVDLAIMPIAPLLNEAISKGFKPFYIPLVKNNIPNEAQEKELSAVEDILMVGYPIGIWDQKNNYPVFRKGITATHPANDYNGNKEFMIDAACFPGSSGSPVVLYNVGSFANKNGETVLGSRFYFLGILYAGPQYTATGEIKVVDIPTKTEAMALSRIPTNLGFVIKSKRLFDFDEILKKLISKGQKHGK